MTNAASVPDVHRLTFEIATHLPQGWRGEPDPKSPAEAAYLVHQDGSRVHLYIDRYARSRDAGRITAYGCKLETPSGMRGVPPNFGRITLAATKSARQLARDVSRRLLPLLAAAQEIVRAQLDQHQHEEALRSTVAGRLAALPHVRTLPRSPYGSPSEQLTWHLAWQGVPRGEGPDRGFLIPEARVSVTARKGFERVGVTLTDLSADQAERVLRALDDAPKVPAGY
ncbi:hypothetical protein ACWCWD_29595 [Streptomyces sp. NPDC001493]